MTLEDHGDTKVAMVAPLPLHLVTGFVFRPGNSRPRVRETCIAGRQLAQRGRTDLGQQGKRNGIGLVGQLAHAITADLPALNLSASETWL